MRKADQPRRMAFFIDLIIYISAMFLVREVYFSEIGFIANGLMWSLTTLAFAIWRMRARGISWKDLGLRGPESYWVALIATVAVLAMAIVSIIAFEMVKDQFVFELKPDDSAENAVSKVRRLAGQLGPLSDDYSIRMDRIDA